MLSKEQTDLLELFSGEINNGKRVEESYLLDHLLKEPSIKTEEFRTQFYQAYGFSIADETLLSIISNLNFEFIKKPKDILSLSGANIELEPAFRTHLENKLFREFLEDSISYSIFNYNSKFKIEKLSNGFLVGEKYSRKDVCRILNWPTDISSVVYGYKTVNGQTPCFVTYKKSNQISESTQYNDHFIDQETFAWESRSNRKLESQEIQNVINSDLILLFVKKSDGEGTDFYCMGDVEIVEGSVKQDVMPRSSEPVVHFKYKLKYRVEDHLYEYLTDKA